MLELNPSDISKQLLDLRNLKPIIFSFSPTEVLAFLDVLGVACQQHLESREDDCRVYLNRVEVIKQRVEAFTAQHLGLPTTAIAIAHQDSGGAEHYKKIYKYVDQGKERTWSGRGRMPKAIKAALATGKQLTDFESN